MVRSDDGEQVLCVERSALFPDGAWHGLVTTGLDALLTTIRQAGVFRPRALVEDDPAQQQIVPYCIVEHVDGTYLLTRRLRSGSESRLHDRCSLGVGGHINPEDGERCEPVIGGLAREWAEEIVCGSPATARLVALVKDDGNAVSRVHLGLVFLVRPQNGRVSIRELHKLAGECLDLEQLRPRYRAMETWSQFVFDELLDAPVRPDPGVLITELTPTAGYPASTPAHEA